MDMDLNQSILSAVLGFASGLGSSSLRAWFEDRRGRKRLADALVVELDRVMPQLERLKSTGKIDMPVEFFAIPLHEQFLGRITSFDHPSVMQVVAEFCEEIRKLRRCLEVRQLENSGPSREWSADEHMLQHGARALKVANAERAALLALGATVVVAPVRPGVLATALDILNQGHEPIMPSRPRTQEDPEHPATSEHG